MDHLPEVLHFRVLTLGLFSGSSKTWTQGPKAWTIFQKSFNLDSPQRVLKAWTALFPKAWKKEIQVSCTHKTLGANFCPKLLDRQILSSCNWRVFLNEWSCYSQLKMARSSSIKEDLPCGQRIVLELLMPTRWISNPNRGSLDKPQIRPKSMEFVPLRWPTKSEAKPSHSFT